MSLISDEIFDQLRDRCMIRQKSFPLHTHELQEVYGPDGADLTRKELCDRLVTEPEFRSAIESLVPAVVPRHRIQNPDGIRELNRALKTIHDDIEKNYGCKNVNIDWIRKKHSPDSEYQQAFHEYFSGKKDEDLESLLDILGDPLDIEAIPSSGIHPDLLPGFKRYYDAKKKYLKAWNPVVIGGTGHQDEIITLRHASDEVDAERRALLRNANRNH